MAVSHRASTKSLLDEWIACDTANFEVKAFPLDGGTPIQIGTFIYVSWPLDGRSVLMGAYLVPLRPGEALPQIPVGGFNSEDEIARLPGARLINADGVVLGPSDGEYAFYKGTIQRNLYRIPIS